MISHGYTLMDSVVVRRKEKKSPARSILDRGELRYLMSLNAIEDAANECMALLELHGGCWNGQCLRGDRSD
jgi:hypothetical protein